MPLNEWTLKLSNHYDCSGNEKETMRHFFGKEDHGSGGEIR